MPGDNAPDAAHKFSGFGVGFPVVERVKT